MKASTIFFLLFISHFWLFGQENSLLNRKVTVSFSDTSIEEILKSLESQQLSFVYSPEVFDVKKRVSINRVNTRLSIVLAELFVGQQVEMRELRGQILLRKQVIPRVQENQKSIDTAQVQPIQMTQNIQVENQDSLTRESPRSNKKEQNKNLVLVKTDTAQPIEQGDISSFGSNSDFSKNQILVQATTFIPRWSTRPYALYEHESNALALDYSLLLPNQYEEQPQASIWDDIATENRKNQKREKKEKKATDDKKFRMGLGVYTGFAALDNLDAFLIGGRLMYYPSVRTGVGFNANALLTKSFYSETLQRDIRVEGGYGGLAIEYVLFPKSVIHLNLPLTLGAGGYNYVETEDPFAPLDPANSRAFFMIELGAELEVNVASFLKVGAGFSYRSISGSDFLNRNSGQDVIKASALEGVNYGIILKFGRF